MDQVGLVWFWVYNKLWPFVGIMTILCSGLPHCDHLQQWQKITAQQYLFSKTELGYHNLQIEGIDNQDFPNIL